MHVAFAALFCFAVLTLWVPAYWPVTVFQIGVFALAAITLWRARRFSLSFPYPLFPLLFAVLLGFAQWAMGITAYPFETQVAILRWLSFLCVFLVGYQIFLEPQGRQWFREAMLWFASGVAVLATVQTFTSDGKVFWLFQTEYGNVMGPILSRNHYAAFIEAVLPFALYEAARRRRGGLVYAGMAAAMYASVIASASRAGTALTTAEILVVIGLMWATGRIKGREAGMSLLQMAALFCIFTAVVGWGRVWNRLWLPDPMATRGEHNVATLHMISDHPWAGVGLGAWPTVYPRYALADSGLFSNQAHDDWLEWTAEGGIFLGIAMATVFFWSLRPAFRSIWGVGLIAVFLHAIVDYPFSRPALGSWPIVILAMLAAREARRAKEVVTAESPGRRGSVAFR